MTRRTLRSTIVLLLGMRSALAAQQTSPDATIDTTQAAARIRTQVQAMAAADSITGRREAIVARLRALGLQPRLDSFPHQARAGQQLWGVNVVARIGGPGDSTILLGAHYDRVSRGRGVIDNAAGVATVLELAAAFARHPRASRRPSSASSTPTATRWTSSMQRRWRAAFVSWRRRYEPGTPPRRGDAPAMQLVMNS